MLPPTKLVAFHNIQYIPNINLQKTFKKRFQVRNWGKCLEKKFFQINASASLTYLEPENPGKKQSKSFFASSV